MAHGQQHALATVIAGGVLSAGLLMIAHRPLAETVVFGGGCLAGLLINPDLDVRHFTYAEQVVRASGGPLGRFLARLWFAVWWPYSRLIPHHRHPLSHFPLLGTAGRLLYLGVIIGLIACLVFWLFQIPPITEIPPETIGLSGWWCSGLAAVDALHALMDSF